MSRSNDIAGLTTSILDGVTATEVGLGNVDNTSDANKPVSTAQQSAIDLKANIASPTFTGTTNISSGATFPANPTITLGSNATGGSGLTAHGRIGHYIRGKLNANIGTRNSGATILNGAKTWTPSGYNTDVFEGQTSGSYGLKCKIAGKYLFTWATYCYANSSTAPITDGYTQEYLYNLNDDGIVSSSYVIYMNGGRASEGYMMLSHSYVMDVTANHAFVPYINCTASSSHYINSSSHISAIFLG